MADGGRPCRQGGCDPLAADRVGGGALALVEFRPETGRTHQIRVHVGLLGADTALLGDPVYGRGDPLGLMLHARGLAFAEPQSGEWIEVVSPLPERFQLPGFQLDDGEQVDVG